jgi:parallel beta-helix repeat protein
VVFGIFNSNKWKSGNKTAKIFYQGLTQDSLANYNTSSFEQIKIEDVTRLYAVNFAEGGWVLMSNDDGCTPVLAYSTFGGFSYEQLGAAEKSLVDQYAKVVDITTRNGLTNTNASNLWKKYSSAANPFGTMIVRQPLLEYYNSSLWTYHQPNFKGLITNNVCVPLALSQYVKYYQWPVQAHGVTCYDFPDSIEFENLNGRLIDYDERNYSYDYNNMPYKLVNFNNPGTTDTALWGSTYPYGYDLDSPKVYEINHLQYDMIYTSNFEPGSPGCSLNQAMTKFSRFYSYNRDYSILVSSMIDTNSFAIKQVLRDTLDNLKPLVFSTETHLMILDGYRHNTYDNTTFFHFVPGWGNYNTGDPRYWYLFNVDDVDSNYTEYGNAFTFEAFLNLYPKHKSEFFIGEEENLTWNVGNNKYNVDTILIESGSTLTINSEVHMNQNGIIIVEEGATLNIGGTVTCDSANWIGIFLKGELCLRNNSTRKCRVNLNGGTIENAIIGINVNYAGVVDAINSNFINNKTSIYFSDSRSMDIQETQNASRIENCTFKIDSNNINNNFLSGFIKVFDNEMILRIKGNTFENTLPFTGNIPERGTGIYSSSSNIEILCGCDVSVGIGEECPEQNKVKNEFIGLRYGVNSSTSYIVETNISDNIFTNNYRGIIVSGMNNVATITKNYFESTVDSSQTYQIYLLNTSGYTVEENQIVSGKGAGIYVSTTGDDNNEIYKNTFTNLTNTTNNATALIAHGVNSDYDYNDPIGYPGENGLEFHCNQIDSSNYAIGIVEGNMRKDQGLNGGTTDKLAGNTFDHYGTQSERDFIVDVSLYGLNPPNPNPIRIPAYNYFEHDDTLTRIYFYSSEVTSYTNTGMSFDSSQACPSHLVVEPPHERSMVVLQTNVETLDAEISSVENELVTLVDNGNTNILLSQTETANDNNFEELSDNIKTSDGYLSDAVAKEYIKSNVAQDFIKANTLIEVSPLPTEAKQELEISDLSPTLKQIVIQYQNGKNIREQKELIVANKKHNRQMLINKALRTVLNDTVPETIDSLIEFLETRGEINNRYTLFALQVKQKRFADAQSELTYLSSIKNNYSEKKQQEIENFINLQSIIIDLNKNYTMFDTLVEQNLGFLNALANDSSSILQSTAWNMLEQAGKRDAYREIVKLPQPSLSPKSAKVEQAYVANSSFNKIEPIINIYPNPADNHITVEYAMLDKDDEITVNIIDMQGKTLKTVKSNNQIDVLRIDISNLAKGNYNVQFQSAKQEYHTVKIIKK